MGKKYLAYGSNLNVPQMHRRCPGATVLGTAELKGYGLLFRGSRTGSYLTVEEKEGGRVPVAVWDVTEEDEKNLDRYEGFPRFYYKKEMKVRVKGIRTGRWRTVTAFVYIMHEDRPLGIPSEYYMDVCREGYDTFYFDKQILEEARERSIQRALESKTAGQVPLYGKRIQNGLLKGFTMVKGDGNGKS